MAGSGYDSDPFVKLRDKIFGPEKKKPKPAKLAEDGEVEMKKGGYVRAADGCVKRGKTKGKIV